MKPTLAEIAERLMRHPAVPYHESLVAEEVLGICRDHKLAARVDTFGNILIGLPKARRGKPFVLAAHLDHPGFIIRKRARGQRWVGEFLGGVGDGFFKRDVPLVLMPGGTPAFLGRRLETAKRVFEISTSEMLETAPEFAVWDLPAFSLENGRVTGRACDDLIGAATILHVLIQFAGSRPAPNVVGVLSRAEEVGFHGALALARSRKLPADSLVISLETSKELPGVQMGAGVILRVGDRTSTFDSATNRFLAEVASGLGRAANDFKWQRALMSGGTCEATAYQEFGYRCGAVCVALGNYHNCGNDGSIQAEYVSLADAESMSLLLQKAAAEFSKFRKLTRVLPERLTDSAKAAMRSLRALPLKLAK